MKKKDKKKRTDQELLTSLLSKTILEIYMDVEKDGFAQIVLPKKISTENGYFQHAISFCFDKKGKLEDIVISIQDYELLPSSKFGSVINRAKCQK